MKKVSKAILIGFAVLAALGVALVAGLNLYVQSPGSQARIQEELSKALRLPLKLTNISVSPFGSLRITGITIPNGGANFLEAASFNARYLVLPLLQNKLVITEMSVENPKIVWVQTTGGKWKLPEPEQAAKEAKEANETPKPKEVKEPKEPGAIKVPKENPPETAEKKPAAPEKKSAFDVIVNRFDVEGGAVDLLDKDMKHVAAFSNVNMTYTSLTAERVEGTATIGKLVWADTFVLENVKTPFSFADGAFNLPEITAAFAGGTLQGRFHTHTEQTHSPFKIAIGFNKLDLDRLSTQTGAPAGQTLGSISGQIEVHGDTQQTDRLEGVGRVDLRDAQFHQLDLFQTIGQLLGLTDLRVRDGHGDFRLNDEKIAVEKITLNTADLQLTAQGTARLNKRLNLTAQISAEDAVVKRLPEQIRDSFIPVDGGRRALDFTIGGTMDKPKTNLVDKLIGKKLNTQFDGLLQGFFGGDKKPEDEKANKERKKKEKEKAAEKNADAPPVASAPPQPVAPSPPPVVTPQPQPAAPNP